MWLLCMVRVGLTPEYRLKGHSQSAVWSWPQLLLFQSRGHQLHNHFQFWIFPPLDKFITLAQPANVRNVNATANLVINSIIEILFTLIWNSCMISMVMRIWKYYLLQKTSNIIQSNLIFLAGLEVAGTGAGSEFSEFLDTLKPFS